MGRPFEKELENINATVTWAHKQSVDDLKNVILENSHRPFYIVGSGGSFSACCYAADLLLSHGFFAKAITPLSIHQNRIRVFKANLIFISASGKNTDIISSYQSALSQDPNLAISISLKPNSPLKKLSQEYSTTKHFDFTVPAGKDGFLATNSLIAFFVLLKQALSGHLSVEKDYLPDQKQLFEIKNFSKKNSGKKSFIVLYGGWSYSVAVDLESKFSEAALGNVLLSDYRNFGHGRHHWFDKQSKESVIVLLITPEEEALAIKTIDILPKTIPHLKLSVNEISPSAAIQLLIQSFHFVNAIGKGKKIDPGRPGVPEYGSKLYNLKYKSLIKSTNGLSSKEHLAISRKVGFFHLLSAEEISHWNSELRKFTQLLSTTRFGGIIFDYDGTLCSSENRFKGMSADVSKAVNDILERGFIIGIATGRGKSVREDFQSQVPERHWKQVVIAYYNGSDIASLEDATLPDTEKTPHPSLISIARDLEAHPLLKGKFKPELRPYQLMIKISNGREWQNIREIIVHILMVKNYSDVQMLESSHSCDIVIKSKASKLNIFPFCKQKAEELNCNPEFICLGDRGKWPGNDFELLSHKYSLSVDEVSPDMNSCWNLSEAGKRNTEATLEYLSKIKWRNSDHSFSLVI